MRKLFFMILKRIFGFQYPAVFKLAMGTSRREGRPGSCWMNSIRKVEGFIFVGMMLLFPFWKFQLRVFQKL
ncbi:hypothetical protein VI26_13945 [Chromobacterium sp. LK1]|nr:hypothetical protein VI26_13945 [Chromobacterium sp. LK1]